MYEDVKEKYSGVNDSFEYKIGIFKDYCNRADVPIEAYQKAFPSMLTGQAKDQYYTSGASQAVDFGTAYKIVQDFFKGPNYH